MRILHTADWHLGKNLHGQSLIDEQKHIMNEIVDIAKKQQVEAVIISGDLYDKPIPSIEATELLEDTLYKLNVELGLPVLAISGNHDSAARLSFGNQWYEKNQLYVSGGLHREIDVVTLGQVQFWLVPFHDVQTARQVFQDQTILNVDEAMQRVVKKIQETADITKQQVLIGHAFVAGGLMSDSERSLSVGNVERVSIPTFDFFTYTALGHLHNPNAINEPRIKYSGSPLKYSFSESEQQKIVRIVDINKEDVVLREVPLWPKRDVRIITGKLEDLLAHPKEPVDDYIKVVLEDEGTLIDPMSKLKQVYPNVLHLERKVYELKESTREDFATVTKQNIDDVFNGFFEYVTGKETSIDQKEVLLEVISKLNRGEK